MGFPREGAGRTGRLLRAALPVAAVLVGLTGTPAGAQEGRGAAADGLPAVGEFARRYPNVADVLSAVAAIDVAVYDALAAGPEGAAVRLDPRMFERFHGDLRQPADAVEPRASGLPGSALGARDILQRTRGLYERVLDVYADDRIQDKARGVDAALEVYLRERQSAIAAVPKEMAVMDERPNAAAFREANPDVNGLLWASHWLRLAVLEPLVAYETPEERAAGLTGVLERFREMLDDVPENAPSHAPMAPAIAPRFVMRHGRAAAVLDNMHMMHGVVSDILASEARADEPAAIAEAVEQFTDPRHLALPELEWIRTSLRHGIFAQGGPAIGRMDRSERNDGHHGGSGPIVIPGMPIP